MLKRTATRRQRQSLPPPPAFQPIPIHHNTIVLGLDPNKPGGCVAGGPAAEVGVKPTVSFNVSRDEYFELIGKNRTTRRLNAYKEDLDFAWLESQLVTSKTSDPAVLTRRLEQIAEFGDVLLDCYHDGPSAKDRWSTTIAKPRALHQMARRFAILGQRDANGKDYRFVARARNRMGKRDREKAKRMEQEKKPPDIVLAVGDLDIVNVPGIRGSSMPLKKLCKLLLEKQYVRALVSQNEDRTSIECNSCYFNGNPTYMANGQGRDWRRKRCPRCGVWWHRDVNAALNIRAVFLYRNSHGGARPANFRRGFRGHAPVPAPVAAAAAG